MNDMTGKWDIFQVNLRLNHRSLCSCLLVELSAVSITASLVINQTSLNQVRNFVIVLIICPSLNWQKCSHGNIGLP